MVGDVEDDALRDAVTKGRWMEVLRVLQRLPAVVSLDQLLAKE